MNRIRTLIVDDEPQAIKRIERLLISDGDFEIVGKCFNTKEAETYLNRTHIDLMFLDIEMPGTNGIQFMGSLPEKLRPQVVYVTAFDDFAVMAFEFYALDYVLKPFSNERFHKTLERIKKQFNSVSKNVDWNEVDQFIQKKEMPKDRFVVKTGHRYEFIPFDSVNYIHANGAYVTLICHDGRKVLYRETLTRLIELLNPFGFIRVHHSSIVLAANIKGMSRLPFGDLEVIMNDGATIRVSRKYKNEIKHYLKP